MTNRLVYVAGPMTSDPYGCVAKACHAFTDLRRRAALVRLPGDSPGADQEVAHAQAIGLPVFHFGMEWPELDDWAATLR